MNKLPKYPIGHQLRDPNEKGIYLGGDSTFSVYMDWIDFSITKYGANQKY